MFVELEILDDVGMCGENLVVMLDGNADDLFGSHSDSFGLHILLVFEHVVRWFNYTTERMR